MSTFTDCADNLICSTLSGSNGVNVGFESNKIITSLDSNYFSVNSSTITVNGALNTLSANTWNKPQRSIVTQVFPVGSTLSIDFSLSNDFLIDLTLNGIADVLLMLNPSNAVAGQSGVISVKQNLITSKNIYFDNNWKKASGTVRSEEHTSELQSH